MEGYIRGASIRLQAVTGQVPSEAFFDMIRRPDVIGDSGPPAVAIAAMRATHPDHLADFVLRLTDAHFTEGADYGDPMTYDGITKAIGLPALDLTQEALAEPALAQAEWAAGRALGLTSYPALWTRHGAATAEL